MRLLRRAENLIVALTLVATGGGGLVYFYFSDTSWAPGDDRGAVSIKRGNSTSGTRHPPLTRL
jgi:hypothetical protein